VRGGNMLTIGQLAAHAGAMVRTVRHDHTTGLLPEPKHDASGYRRRARLLPT
jgi:DNA-binding transcriptional MerR regulator